MVLIMAGQEFSIGIEHSGFDQDVKHIEKKLSDTGQAGKVAGATLDEGFKKNEAIKTKIREVESLRYELDQLNRQRYTVGGGDELDKVMSRMNEVTAEITKGERALADMKKSLNEVSPATDNVSNSIVSLTTQIRKNNDALADMRSNNQQLSPEYQNLIQKNAELSQSLKIVRKEVTSLTAPGTGLQAITQLAGGIAGGFAAAQGAIGLFSEKNEDLQKVMLKVQSAMAITMGLQQAAQLVDKKSAFQIGILTPLRRAYNAELAKTGITTTTATAGTAALAAGETTATVATFSLTTAFKALRTAIFGIPLIGWLLAVIAALGTAYGILRTIHKKQLELTDAQKQRLELQKKEREAHIQAAESVEQIRAKLNVNLTAIKNLEEGTAAHTQAVKDTATQLGVSEQWLRKNIDQVGKLTDAYIKMQEKVALANEYTKQSAEMIVGAERKISGIKSADDVKSKKELINDLKELSEKEKKNWVEYVEKEKELRKTANTTTDKKIKADIEKALKTREAEIEGYEKKITDAAAKSSAEFQKTAGTLFADSADYQQIVSDAIDASNNQGKSQKDWEDRQKQKAQFMLDVYKKIEEIEADSEEKILNLKIETLIRETQRKVKEYNIQGAEYIKVWQSVQMQAEQLNKEYQEKRNKELLSLEEETARLLIETKKQGFEKETALHEQRLQQIEDERNQRLKKAGDDEEWKEKINENSNAKKDLEQLTFTDKMLDKYATYTDKRIELEKRFNSEIEYMQKKNWEAAQKGFAPVFSQDQIELAKNMRIKALAELDDQTLKSNNLIVKMFANTHNKSSKELEALKKEIEEFIEFLEGGQYISMNKWGLTREQFQNYIKSEELEKFKKALADVTEEGKKFNNGMDDIIDNFKKLKEALNEGNTKDAEKAFGKLGASLKNVGSIASGIGKDILGSLKGISSELDGKIQSLGSTIETVGSMGKNMGEGMSAGGAMGAFIMFGIELIKMGIRNVAQAKKEYWEDIEKNAQRRLDIEHAIYEIQKRRLDLSRKIGETELEYLERSLKLLEEQLKIYKDIRQQPSGTRDNPVYREIEGGKLKDARDKLFYTSFMDFL